MTLGILRVAACLEERGESVEVIDLSGIENFQDAMADCARNSPARIFALTATSPQMPAAAAIVAVIRKERPEARIILGGPHATLVNAAAKRERKIGLDGRASHSMRRLLEIFDVIVAGDGDVAIFEAISDCPPTIIDADDPKSSMFLTNAALNDLPFPARHLVDVESYHYAIDGERALSAIFQLGCPFASVSGDSFIFTDRGFEKLDDMLVGQAEEVKCVHGNTLLVHQVNRSVCTKSGQFIAPTIIDEGLRHVFEVKTENGMSVEATAEHPLFALVNGKPDWKKVAELKKGDYLIQVSPERKWPTEFVKLEVPSFPEIPPGGFKRKTDQIPSEVTEDVAWLTGFIIGDGCLPVDGRPAVHVCVTPDVEERLKRTVFDLFGVRLAINKSSVTNKMKHGWIHSRAAYDFFVKSMGINPTSKLHIPECIIRSPMAVVQAFVDGLMDADGYENGGHPYLTTVSSELAREFACLLLMLGHPPNVYEVNNGSGHCFRVGILHNDRIPTDRALCKARKSGKWRWRTPRQPESFLGVRRRTLKESVLFHPLNVSGWHYVRVESITPCFLLKRVYDLNVPGEHSFLVNGFIAHNCGFCGGRESPMLRRIRTRTTESVVREIEHMYKAYGVKGIMAYDDELNVNPQMIPLMHEIAALQQRLGVEFRLRGFIKSQLFTDDQAEAMYAAGFRWILVGFESGSPRILENMNKKATREENTRCMEIAKRHGLKTKALMSIGHPGESKETVAQTLDWLLQVRPDDFDVTIITTYPGTPYYDHAIRSKDKPGVWTYSVPSNKDRLHAVEVDFMETADYYKGDPDGGYHAYVFTDFLSQSDLVSLRDETEREARRILEIPFNPSGSSIRYEHSMGQGAEIPGYILRRSMESANKVSA